MIYFIKTQGNATITHCRPTHCTVTKRYNSHMTSKVKTLVFISHGAMDWSVIVVFLGPEVMKLFSCSTQLSTKFILLINVKMPTIVGILTFISMINISSEILKSRNFFFVSILVFLISSRNFVLS